MATKSHRTSQDRKRVSSESHEISYTGRKVSRTSGVSRARGKSAVKRAKRQTGTVSRGPVERRATKIARRGTKAGSGRARR